MGSPFRVSMNGTITWDKYVIEEPSSIAVALYDILVGIDASVTQKWPDVPDLFTALPVDGGRQKFRFGSRTGQQFSLRPGNETMSPEMRTGRCTTRVGFIPDAVDCDHR